MGNVGKGGRHWSYSNKCNRKVCHRTGLCHFPGGPECMCQCIAIEACRLAHQQAIQSGCKSDAFVGNGLIDMYLKCGSMEV